jgi:hypothetical protein
VSTKPTKGKAAKAERPRLGNMIQLTPAEFRDIRAKAAEDALRTYGIEPHDVYYAIPRPLFDKFKQVILYFLDDNAGLLSAPFDAADLFELERSRSRKLSPAQLPAAQ